ncbi:mitochondrial carrier domain-containing protein, partial [Blyttiomyces helicus]
LVVVKTRFQLQVGNSEYSSILDCFKKIMAGEGPRALYRGIPAPILVEAPKRAIKFGANDAFGHYYKDKFGFKDGKALAVLTGVSAGIAEAILVNPFELVKIRMQDKGNAGVYNGTGDCVKKIFASDGALGFTRGLEATMFRHAVWNGGYFGVISGIRSTLPEAETKQGTLARNFVAGTLGGTFATMLNTPFDVAKTRIQGQTAVPFKYGATIPSILLVAREEGVGALYKGFLPKVLRLGPGGGILLVVYEVVTTYMRK